jgi:hypothetical protein
VTQRASPRTGSERTQALPPRDETGARTPPGVAAGGFSGRASRKSDGARGFSGDARGFSGWTDSPRASAGGFSGRSESPRRVASGFSGGGRRKSDAARGFSGRIDSPGRAARGFSGWGRAHSASAGGFSGDVDTKSDCARGFSGGERERRRRKRISRTKGSGESSDCGEACRPIICSRWNERTNMRCTSCRRLRGRRGFRQVPHALGSPQGAVNSRIHS